jgi:hypothetical protein
MARMGKKRLHPLKNGVEFHSARITALQNGQVMLTSL